MRTFNGNARSWWWLVVVAFAVLCGQGAALADRGRATYQLREVNVGPGVYTSIFGINNRGTLVGNAADPDDVSWAHVYGFVGDGVTFEKIVVDPSDDWDYTTVTQVNDHGVAVGEFSSARSPFFRGFVREPDGTIEILPLPDGALGLEAMDINNRGVIAGIYFADGRPHGFTYTDGEFITRDVAGAVWTHVTGIDDRGRLAGRFLAEEDGQYVQHGFLMDGDDLLVLDFPGAVGTYARDVNNAGQVAGLYFDENYSAHGFVWYKGRFQSIEYEGSAFGDLWLMAINDKGVVVGTYDYFSWGIVGSPVRGR